MKLVISKKTKLENLQTHGNWTTYFEQPIGQRGNQKGNQKLTSKQIKLKWNIPKLWDAEKDVSIRKTLINVYKRKYTNLR